MPEPRASPAGLIGRERECAQLAALVGVAADGAGGVALVSGEAGVGKTALVEAALAGSPLLAVRAAASPVATPTLGPIVQAAHALQRELPQAFAQHPALARLLGEAAGDVVAADRPWRALVDALCALARQRAFALILEDMQWADRATLELVAELAQQARRVALLVVLVHRSDGMARGHPVRTLRETLRRARILNEVIVEPLDQPEALQLAARCLDSGATAAVQQAIAERSGGIPLFIEAMAAALRSRGAFDSSRAPPLPETVRDAILESVDALPAAGRQAAQAAAVAGSDFAWPLLIALNGGEDGIDACLDSGLLRERDQGGGAAFRTPLAREAIHAAIPWERRRSMHRRAAQTLCATGSCFEQAAVHWQAAGDDTRSRDAWLKAAQRSRLLHAHADAAQQLRHAIDLWPAEQDSDERLATLEQLGDSAQLAGRFADALRAWREVADAAQGSLAAARALRKIASLHELSGDWANALEAREDAAGAFACCAQPAEAAADLFAAGLRLRYAGQYAAALELLGRAAAAAEAGGAADTALRIAALTGNVLARCGRIDEGIAMARSALASALERNRPDLAGESYLRLADSIERASDFATAVEAYREGVELCERNGLAVTAGACLMCMSYALFRTGAWDDTLAGTRRVLASSDSDAIVSTGAHAVTALVLLLRGESRRAAPFLQAAGARSRQVGSVTVEFVGRWALALHDAHAGDLHAAAQRCHGVLARWRQAEEGGVATPVLRWAATCLAEAGDRDGVRACVDALSQIAARLGHADALSALAHGLGEVTLQGGDAVGAAGHFEHAVALLGERGFPLERAYSQWRGAAACAACGRNDEAVARLRDAARGAERLGARPLADAVAQALRALGQPLAGALGPRAGGRAARAGLTARQAQVLAQVAQGLTDKEVARALNLSPRTIEMHVARALAALDCRSRTEAVRKVTELGLLAAQG